MSRRFLRSRYGWSGKDWAAYHRRQREEVSDSFRGIDHDIQRLFLDLGPDPLERLLSEYSRRHGASAAAYARRTLPDWRRGTVQLSGTVALRLIDLLPRYIPFQTRHELIRKLRSAFLIRHKAIVTCTPTNWRELIGPAITMLVADYRQQRLPDSVMRKARWLALDDSRAADTLIAQAEEEETALLESYLPAEFSRIDTVLNEWQQGSRVTLSHTITLPQGDVIITIQPERKGLIADMISAVRRFWSGE